MSGNSNQINQPQLLSMAGQTMTLKVLTPEDEPAFLKLHQEVFGSSVDSLWFNWKYKLGKSVGMSLWFKGRMVAHCGGIPRSVLHHGVLKQDLQIGDVMVLPEWRGALTRQNPFFHVSKGLYQTFVGAGKPFHMGFGFPNDRHLSLAVKLGILWRIGEVHQLRWNLRQGTKSSTLEWLWLDEHLSTLNTDRQALHTNLKKRVSQAWQAMQQDASSLKYTMGQRDWTQFEWRFLKRPDKQYQFVALKRPWSAKCAGIAVLSVPSKIGESMLWLDWIGPPSLITLAQHMVLKQARIQQASFVLTWASGEVEKLLANTAIDSIETCAMMGGTIFSDLSAEQAKNLHLWAMAGDTDFL
jgi:hypothetical protein